jgi:ribosome maturation factor RimP
MSARDELERRLTALVRPIVEDEGAELVGVECRGSPGSMTVRIYVDRSGGITLGECARISHGVSDRLEIEDSIAGKYKLEVSSPGLDRPLVTEADFRRAVGRNLRISLADSGEGGLSGSEVVGEILSVEDGAVNVRLAGGRVVVLRPEQIKKAVLVIDFRTGRDR